MKSPARAINELIARVTGLRAIRTRALDRLAGQIAQAEQRTKEAESRGEQAGHRAEQAARRAEQIERTVEQTGFRILPDETVVRDRLSSLGRLLRPQQAPGFRKVRIGAAHDGGYICLDDFKGIDAALSFGIGLNATWDVDIAARGLTVYQYDHSVIGPPVEHARLRFHRRKLAGIAGGQCESIESILAKNHLTRPASLICKIDIEHDEWETLAAAPVDALNKFAQVVCEFHGFDQITDDQWFERALNVLGKLNDRFAVVHVHGNNYAPMLATGHLRFPQVLEVTYANRGKYAFGHTNETFPGPFDAANSPSEPDHSLGNFIY